MIEILDVAKQFTSKRGTTEALAGMSLRIDEGELVCLVGPSGCGKTTLLNLIAGLEEPDAGEVRVGGQRVTGPGPDRAVMFQEAALFPWLSTRRNVEFGLAMLGVRRRERHERAQRWLEVVGMRGFADASVHELSGGMRQRVALARALALEPQILPMDEPFAALDVHARAELHDELERLWLDTGKTIVFVTHDIVEAVRLASRVIVLDRRPARVRSSIAIDLPRPRSDESPEVVELGREVSDGLQRAPSPVGDAP